MSIYCWWYNDKNKFSLNLELTNSLLLFEYSQIFLCQYHLPKCTKVSSYGATFHSIFFYQIKSKSQIKTILFSLIILLLILKNDDIWLKLLYSMIIVWTISENVIGVKYLGDIFFHASLPSLMNWGLFSFMYKIDERHLQLCTKIKYMR